MMPKEDKQKFEDKRPDLMEGIYLDDGHLFAHLRKRGVITSDQEGAIKDEPGGNSRKVGKLLDILLKGDCHTLKHFKDSLAASSPAHKTLAEECFGADTSTAHKSHFLDPESERPLKLAKYEDTEMPEPLPTSAPMVHLVHLSPPEQAKFEYAERICPYPNHIGNSKEHFEWWKGYLGNEVLTDEEEHRLKQIESSFEDQEDKDW